VDDVVRQVVLAVVMKIFWPEIRYWSAWRSARVRTRDRSDPACGSVRFIVPVHLPSIIFGR